MKSERILRILFSVRSDLLIKQGGDTLHISHLKELLETAGHHIDLAFNESEHKIKSYDIVHFFNLSIIDHNFTIFIQAKKHKLKTCFTSIFQNPKYFDSFAPYSKIIPKSVLEKCKLFLLLSQSKLSVNSFFKVFVPSHHTLQKYFLSQCDQVFCNSNQEIKDLENHYSISIKNKSEIVIPTFNLSDLHHIDDDFLQEFNHKDYILIVGRIEKLKNQIRILEALKELNNEVVFIGPPNHNNKRFINKFYKLLKKRKKAFHYPDLSRKLVLSAIKNARLVIQGSCVENLGFVSLEAHYFNTDLLVSNNSYFNFAMNTNYPQVNPYSISSIKNAATNSIFNKSSTKPKYFCELLDIENSFVTNTLSTYLKIVS